MRRSSLSASTALILTALPFGAFAETALPAWAQSDVVKSDPTAPLSGPPGRFQIVLSPLMARDTFLLDTATGRVWQLVKGAKGDELWEQMERSDSGDPKRNSFNVFDPPKPVR